MNRRHLLILAWTLALSGAAPVTGRWRSVATTKGGIGAVYEFHATGSVTYSSAAIVEMDYQQDANTLTLGGQAIGMGWHKDGRLQLNYGNNELEDFSRQGKSPDAANPLLGEWKGSRMMEGRRIPVSLQFHAGNKALLVLYLKDTIGRYKAAEKNGEFRLVLPPLPARKITHDSAAGQLTITVDGGDPHQFARF